MLSEIRKGIEKEKGSTLSKLEKEKRNRKLSKLVDRAYPKYLENILKHSRFIFIEITPVCDHAQADAKFHRIIPGVLIRQKDIDFFNVRQSDIGFYKSVPLYIDTFGGPHLLLLDFRGLQTLHLGTLSAKKPLFRLRQEFLFDVQHKAGTHFSRPGIISV